MSNLTHSRWMEVASQIKPIFLRWEKLRVPYNIVLLCATLFFFRDSDLLVRERWIQAMCLVGAVLANLCFLLGPVIESYLHWLGSRSRWVTAWIFVTGILVSLPLVAYFVLSITIMGD